MSLRGHSSVVNQIISIRWDSWDYAKKMGVQSVDFFGGFCWNIIFYNQEILPQYVCDFWGEKFEGKGLLCYKCLGLITSFQKGRNILFFTGQYDAIICHEADCGTCLVDSLHRILHLKQSSFRGKGCRSFVVTSRHSIIILLI